MTDPDKEIIEEILAMSDKEILDAVEEEYGDRLYLAKKFDELLKTVLNKLNN